MLPCNSNRNFFDTAMVHLSPSLLPSRVALELWIDLHLRFHDLRARKV